MFDQVANQFQKTLKPISELATINAKATEQLLQQQTNLFTGVVNDCAAYAEGLSEKKDLAGIMEANRSYALGVQEKIVSATKDAYTVITDAQEKASEILKGAFAEAREAASAAVPATGARKTAAAAPAGEAKKTTSGSIA